MEVSTARRFTPGDKVEVLQLPFDTATAHAIRLRSGPLDARVQRVLPTAAALARRMVPWATLIFAPRIYAMPAEGEGLEPELLEGSPTMTFGGYCEASTIYAAFSCTGPVTLLEVVAHECWHAIESRMAPAWVSHIDSMIDPPIWSLGPYWESRYEVRARAFETWCSRLFHGMTPPTSVREQNAAETLDEIFSSAWAGHLATELMEEDDRDAA